jgi:hypothetical protein
MGKKGFGFSCCVAAGFLLLAGCGSTSSLVGNAISRTMLRTQEAGQADKAMKSYLYGGEGVESGMDIACAKDGFCLLFGETRGSFGGSVDFPAVRIFPDRKIVWAKIYNGSDDDRALYVAASSDGGYLLVGVSKSMLGTPFKSTDKPFYPMIIKTDLYGNIVWAKAIDYTIYKDFSIHSVIQTSDKGYVISGYSEVRQKGGCTLLFKLSGKGDLLWATCYRPSNGMDFHRLRVKEAPDGRLFMSFGASEKFGLLVGDSRGKPQWARSYRGEDTKLILPEDVVSNAKGEFMITACNLFDDKKGGLATAAIVKLSPRGDVIWGWQYDAGSIAYPRAVLAGYENVYFIAGTAGKMTLGYMLGRAPKEIKGFALLVDEDGKEQAAVLSEKGGTGFRSASISRNEYALFGDMMLSETRHNMLLALWQPQKGPSFDREKAVFTRRPFNVQGEDVSIESAPAQLSIMEIKDRLDVHDLKVNNGP